MIYCQMDYNKKFNEFFSRYAIEFEKADEEGREMLFEIATDFVEKNRDFVMQHPLISYWSEVTDPDEKYLDRLMIPYENTDLNLYFHIPFCITKCSYCNFHIVIGKENKNFFSKIYLAKMKKEVIHMLSKINEYNIKTIFI